MKQFTIILLGLGLALMMACSSDKSEDEPIIPKKEQMPEDTTAEWSGKFEGEWRFLGLPTKGMMEVDGENMVFIPFPAEVIFNEIIQIIRTSAADRPEREKRLNDTIGNVFFADSYKYLNTRQEISFSLNTNPDGSYQTSITTLNNMWSQMAIVISIDKVPPYTGDEIYIHPSDPLTISFDVEADGVTYRVDLVHQKNDVAVDFDHVKGLWTFTYRFHEYKIFNQENGKQYSVCISPLQLQFKATRRTGPSDGIIFIYI